MAGNRNPQDAFQVPVLFELAANWGDLDRTLDRGRRTDDVRDFYENVLSLFEFSPKLVDERLPSGELVLINDVSFASHQLKLSGDIKKKVREKWEITEKGLRRLREFIASVCRSKELAQEVGALMLENDESDQELLLNALKRVAEHGESQDAIIAMVIGSTSLTHLFQNAVGNIPAVNFGGFVASAYERLRPLMSTTLAKQYRLKPSNQLLVAT